MRHFKSVAAATAALFCASLIAISAGGASAAAPAYDLPAGGAKWDYQIGGAYTPPTGTKIVSRDREAAPAAGVYNICYVNAFQTQPGELATVWKSNKSLLAGKKGVAIPATADPSKKADAKAYWVRDGGWNEILLDTSTTSKRTALMNIIGPWIDKCAQDGFDAVEPDNLDSWSRNAASKLVLTEAGNVEFAKLLAKRAHDNGLAIAQKNTVELSSQKTTIGFDFAIAEECQAFEECSGYTDYYGNRVLEVEYTDAAFTDACADHGADLSILRRDVNVVKKGVAGYKYAEC